MVKLTSPDLSKTGYELNGLYKLPDLDEKLLQALTYLVGYCYDTEQFEIVALDSDNRVLVSSGAVKTDDGNISRVTINLAAISLLADNPNRQKMIIQNIGTHILYIGFDETVDELTGFPLQPNTIWEDDSWIGAVWGYTDTGASYASIIEMS